MPEITLIKLWRETPIIPGGPTTMDCHPDEVAGCLALDWMIAENTQPPSQPISEPEATPTAELPTTPKLKRNK